MKIHRSRIRSVCALAGFMVAGLAHAGPEGAAVQRGNVTITQTSPTNWEIHASDGSVIHYTGFDIQQTEWVKFIQDNADSRVLNRVFSQNPTEILGRLSANGHVYLVNPAGIFIGPNAQIDANGFHAAAGHISDQDFLAHTEHYTDLKGAVTNLGVISGADVTLSDDGASVVALAGRQVTNGALGSLLGRIYVDGEQGWIVMAAGTDVLITSPSDRFAVQIEGALAAPGELKPGELPLQLTNYGTLQANRGSVGLAAGDTAGIALFQNGTHRVQGSQILVQGGPDAQVDVAGTLDASSASGAGGKIDISGTHVAVHDAKLLASGATAGGSVTLSAHDGGSGSRTHVEAALGVADSTMIDVSVSGASGDAGQIALATEGSLDYATTDTHLDNGHADTPAPGTLSVQATELVVNGSAGAGQAAVSSAVLAAQNAAGQGAKLVLEGTDALRVASAADFSGARQSVELRGKVDSSAAAVTAAGDLSVSGTDLAVGDLRSDSGAIAIDGSGNVALQGQLASTTSVSVDAGTGSSGSAQISLGSGVAFAAPSVSLTQDASILLTSAPGGVAAGDLAPIAARSSTPDGSPLAYALTSREGSVELRSESAGQIALVARAKRDISVADADDKLEAHSADLGVDGAWRPDFDVDVQGLAALRSGLAGSGDLTLERNVDAGSVTLGAGNGTSSSTAPQGAAVALSAGALAHLQGETLSGFRLEQDQSIAQPSQLGALQLANDASYALVSRLGGVSVDAAELDKVLGERVTLESRQGIALDFGSAPRALGEDPAHRLLSFTLHSGDSHKVDYDVFTAPRPNPDSSIADSSIDLAAGVVRDTGDNVSGDLTLAPGTQFYADHVALAAGDGQPNVGAISGRVLIDPTVQFGRLPVTSGTPLAPVSFSLEQDAALGGPAHPLPTRAHLGSLSPTAGEDQITLRSRTNSLTLDAAAVDLLAGTIAVLGAHAPPPGSEDDTNFGVRLTADQLSVKSLRVESDLIVDRTNTGGDDGRVGVTAQGDSISPGDINLAGETPDVAGTRGNLRVRSTARLDLSAQGDVVAGSIQSTSSPVSPTAGAPTDFELQITARNVDATEIQASGGTDLDGGDVKITASGDVTLGAISADAGAVVSSDGDLDGGTVVVDAAGNLSVGNALARGGVLSNGLTPSASDGGNIHLGAGGLLDLTGATYSTREATGLGGVFELAGSFQLSPPLDASGNPVVTFTVGDLLTHALFKVNDVLQTNAQVQAIADASGKIELPSGAQIGAGSLALTAGGDIQLGAGVSAKSLIELDVDADGTGGGGFGAGDPITLASREIRLNAGDVNSTTSDAAFAASDLARFTFTGEAGTGSPQRFQLVQDRAVDLDATDANGVLVDAGRFAGGIAGMQYAVGSRHAGVALSNTAVGGTQLDVSVAGTTGAASSATPDAANGDVTVAGGTLNVASAKISAGRDLRVGFGIQTQTLDGTQPPDGTQTPTGDRSRIQLLSGQTDVGDLSVSGTLQADEIALIAGRAGLSTSLVKLDPAARLQRGVVQNDPTVPPKAPHAFTFEQDASISALPDPATFFPALGLDGMRYALTSHAGDVTLDAAAAARVAGMQLALSGQSVAIRAPLQLANLDANATGAISVDASVTASGNASAAPGTWAPSFIRMNSGSAGAAADLSVGAVTLSADEIALRTGALSFDPAVPGSSRVDFAEGARLGGLAGSHLAQLELEQEASFGASGSPIPTAFIDPNDLPGLHLALTSNSGEIEVDSAAQAPLQGMALALHGARGVTLESGAAGGLHYASLLAQVGTTSQAGLVPFIELHDAVRTDAGALNLLGDVHLVGSGDLSLVARASSSGVDGNLEISGALTRADGPVDGSVGDVSVEADDEVSIGSIDTSGSSARRNAGNVGVRSLSGLAEVGSVRAVGDGSASPGGNGGNVALDGAIVRVGSVDTGAALGNAGNVSLGTTQTRRVEVGGNLSLLGQIPSGGTIEQGGHLSVAAPLALRTGGGLIDAGAIDLLGGVRLAGSGGVTGTGSELLQATARGPLTASGNLVASGIALVGRGPTGNLDLRGAHDVLADAISLEAGEGGAHILLPADIAFRSLQGQSPPGSFHITQDGAIDFGGGANQLVTLDDLVDPGGALAGMQLALESRANQVHVFDPAQVAGTLLSLSGSGTGTAPAVQIDGQVDGALELARLTLGAGTAHVDGQLDVDGALVSAGDLEVGGARASIGGPVALTSDQDQQTVRVGAGAGTLALGGDVLRQNTSGRGDLRLDARQIKFSSIQDQRIAAHGGVPSTAAAGTLPEGKLTITAAEPLLKGTGGLTLEADTGIDLSGIAGRATDGSPLNVVETQQGPLTLHTSSGTTTLQGGLAANGGDLVADTQLDFRGATGASALRALGAVSALQGAQVAGQDLVLASGNGQVHTGGAFAISGGAFAISGGAFVPGADSDLVVERDTSITAQGVALRGASGAGDLLVHSTGGAPIRIAGDVQLDPGASLELGGSSVQLAKTGAQTLSAGSIALTRDAGPPGVMVAHNGDLNLTASSGTLVSSAGAQLVATGDLALSAAKGISLGDSVAANQVNLSSDGVSMGGNATVEANRIHASHSPDSGTFATPTGTEVNSELVGDRVVLRSLRGDGSGLGASDLEGFIAGGSIPPARGPAIGDVSDEAAIWQTAPPALDPPLGLRAVRALAARPLWPDEVLAFLRRDSQSRGGLPDVAAGDVVTAPLNERLRTPDAERAAALYRGLFRPGNADPDAALARLDELRGLFEAAARDERAQGELDAAGLMRRIAGDPAHARALAIARQAAELLARVRALGLAAADYAELRTRLVGPLAPEGIAPADFARAIESI